MWSPKPFPDFIASVKSKKYAKAFELFDKIEDQFLFDALHPLTEDERETFWNSYNSKPARYRLEPQYRDKLERWEFAFETVQYHSYSPKIPDYGAAMPGYAKAYLKNISGVHTHSSLEMNLGYSMQAVNYVLTNVELVAANWDYYGSATKSFEYWDHRAVDARKALADKAAQEQNFRGKSPKQIKAILKQAEANSEKYKNTADRILYDQTRPKAKQQVAESAARQGGQFNWLSQLRIEAATAKAARYGNCGENSALAFLLLYDMGVRPIEQFYASADHNFVVIGRNDVDPNDYDRWGEHAVVADPWAQGFWKGDTSIGTYGGKGSLIKANLRRLLQSEFTLEVNIREEAGPKVEPQERRKRWWQRRHKWGRKR